MSKTESKKVNKDLILDIFRIASPSFGEEDMQQYILEFLTARNIPFIQDTIGNIFNIDQPDKPLLCAHMDTVQDDDDCKLAHLVNIRNNKVINGYGVIGGDDKCGLYIILDLLNKNRRDFNFLFCVQEEVGCHGSTSFVSSKDVSGLPYCIVLDRRGKGDIICYSNRYGTKKFENALKKVGKEFGYKPTHGLISDADNLCEQINCANLSVGYFNAHQKNEFVSLSALTNAQEYAVSIIDNIKEKFDVDKQSYGRGAIYIPGISAWEGNSGRERWDEYSDIRHKPITPSKKFDETTIEDSTGSLIDAFKSKDVIRKTALLDSNQEPGVLDSAGKKFQADSSCRGCYTKIETLYHLPMFDDGFGPFHVCEDCFTTLYQQMENTILDCSFSKEEV